ncbi:MAG: DNA-processing protein DprA [Clostridium sp.]|nr:DNA-processing protein DprA [Clostridium sp.]MCM1208360.1 DNA-processing protein DprA [Ruminococcus sp.]
MTEYENAVFRLWLTDMEGIGIKTQKKLLSFFGDVQEVYHASYHELAKVVPTEKAEKIAGNRSLAGAKKLYDKYAKRNIKIIYPGHEYYPEKLLHIYDYPELLFVRGDLACIKMTGIAVVGSRNPSIYGSETASYFASYFAGEDICTISGLARGIDSAAHKGAIDGGGKTVAVLGCGINVTYPGENAELYERIENHGAILSEYGFDVKPMPGQFPMRNRIISGMSDGVLVVEARKKSGSLITADYALEQGRQVYALPGRIFDLCSEGTNNLIKQGAMCVTNPTDIMFDLFGREEDNDIFKNEEINLTEEEKNIYSHIGLEPVFIDDIIAKSSCRASKTISILYGLLDKELIKQPADGYYIRKIC